MTDTPPPGQRDGDPELAQRIRQALAHGKRSQSDVARFFDLTRQSVHGWTQKGHIAKERIPAFCKFCNVDIEWFLTGKGDIERKDPLDGIPEDELIERVVKRMSPAGRDRLFQRLFEFYRREAAPLE